MRNDLAAAKATAEQARFDYERAKQNYDAKILAEADYQKARSDLRHRARQPRRDRGAHAAGERHAGRKPRLPVEDDRDGSPIDGIVTALPVKEGEVTVIGTMNNAGTQLMTISDMSDVEAVMMVDETSVPQVKVGQTADLTIDAYPGQKFKGVVTEVGSSPIPKTDPDLLSLVANSEAINFKVKIRSQDPPRRSAPASRSPPRS